LNEKGSDAQYAHLTLLKQLPAATARITAAAAAFTSLVAIPAIDRTVATRFKRHCCRLSATRTNHRCTLCRSRTIARSPLIVFLCLTAILATLWGRVAAFLKERLISSGEGEILPAIAARKLNISGHGSPLGNCTAQCAILRKVSFELKKLAPGEDSCVWSMVKRRGRLEVALLAEKRLKG
jgi:hypothetical protein